ncbi:EAL domain-containing protein [Sphingomicrobium marinum]|uniref:EAL domain-containing protein n=1 Tax=Sphingomicrobium marinum TaxID=1227950 RepID=UPI00223F17AB|nr:EAL domain-containing protein [Sphingomicrobium marinum]
MEKLDVKTRGNDRRGTPASLIKGDAALEEAIADKRIGIRFQPQIEPASGRVHAVEALARWEGCGGSLFARARKAGMELPLSAHVQLEALRRAARWTGPMRKLGISINLLPCEFASDERLEGLLDRIDKSGIDPERLTVEIVESSLVADRKAAADRLMALKASGIRIAIDDFGTGYSSLAYLTSLPIDCVKIDRGLITDIVGGNRDRIVVRAMIHLAHELGLDVVVEGVESAAQLELLASWGADLYQGFHGAEALDEEELSRFVSATSIAA